MFLNKSRAFLHYFLLLIPVFTFAVYIYINAVNVPHSDDEGLLNSVNQAHDTTSGLFRILVGQHNDHRIVFSRFASIAIDYLSGSMNFRIMIIAGYLNLILLGHAFFLVFRSTDQKFIRFAPVAILLFSPIVYGTHLWSITAFEQTLAITFSLYALYFIQPAKKKYWYISIPFTIAATLSNLDGLSVVPLILMWLIFQKRTRESLIFTVFSIFYLYFFFSNFHFSESTTTVHFPQIIPVIFKGFIAFCGSIVKIISDSYMFLFSMITGVVILLAYGIFTVMKIGTRKSWGNVFFPMDFAEVSFLKLLACAMMIALGRAGDGAGSMFAARFQIYSASILIVFYLFILVNLKNEKQKSLLFQFFLIGTLALSTLSYVKYTPIVTLHTDALKVDSYNYPNHSLFMHQYADRPDPELKVYDHYVFPDYFKKEAIVRWHEQAKAQKVSLETIFKSEISMDNSQDIAVIYNFINLDISNLPASIPQKNVYLALFKHDSNDKPFLIAVSPHYTSWFKKIRSTSLSNSFTAKLPCKIPADLYDVSLCWYEDKIPKSMLVAKNHQISCGVR